MSIAAYESFLINNASTINTIESTLRSVTWFLPGRFKDAELASESLSASLNLITLYHDTLLARRLADPKYKPLVPPTIHTRYTRAYVERSGLYRWISRALEVIKYVELVSEMTLRRKTSSGNVWKGIVALESVKAALRLFLLRLTRRPLLSPPIPERDFEPSQEASPTPKPTPIALPPQNSDSVPAHLRNNHIPHPFTPPDSAPASPVSTVVPVDEYLRTKALTTTDIRSSINPTSLLRSLSSSRDWVAEVLYILRPLIYVLALARTKLNPASRISSAAPLAVSLAIDLFSRAIRRVPHPSAGLERAEYARRDRDLLWYFLRGDIWESYTKPKLSAIARKAESGMILGLVGAFVKDWIPLIDEYYYYTAS
ncbi:hypothetical protein BOTBODRAFT_156651 [Botryobasidium botryosum FD-172 SS1]|uniref:Peroxisomal membrane protein PEX16 n=1 Tax=Botryobasidium botryosum (strain FD-172 SS1) TaxID=930990 RepID=A0A067MLT7_BOTB1|nr:hypothetical protein BOTBODRAFT_156651 [Botryobasidium botryosum FD-172 SS1]